VPTGYCGDRDGIPVVLMEAMSAGVPVVSGDLPAIRELVEQDVTGTLVRPGDIQALADTLSRLTDDPTRRTRLARDGLRRVQSEFEQGLNISRLRRAFSERAVRSRGACAPLTVPTSSLLHAGMKRDSAGAPSTHCLRKPVGQA